MLGRCGSLPAGGSERERSRSPSRFVVPPRYTRQFDDYPIGSLFIAQQADGYDHVVIKTKPNAKGKQIDSIPNGNEVMILENPIRDSVKIQWPAFDCTSAGGRECHQGFVKMRNLAKKPASSGVSPEHQEV
jgi:hypothetical protein